MCPECAAEHGDDDSVCRVDGAGLIDTREDPILGRTVGSYRLTRVLGAGGMGKVYLGVQPQIGSRVAVKILEPSAAARPDLVERFFVEAMAVNKIRHESIVNVLDVGRLDEGRPYLVMEFLEGKPLSAVLAHHGVLPLGTASRLASEILGALEAAHRAGVVHRDLKPDNIFVSPQGRAKVLDFGIAKLLPDAHSGAERQFTTTGMVLGTPTYMSPEQVIGSAIAPATDVYAMGVILYEASTGRVPFEGATLYELLHHQVHTPPPPPRQRRPDLPPAFEAVILRALAKDPEARFSSAREMAGALIAAAADLPAAEWAEIALGAGDPARDPTARPSPGLAGTPRAAPTPGAFAPTPLVAPREPSVATTTPPPRPQPAARSRAGLGVAIAAAVLGAAVVAAVVTSSPGGGQSASGSLADGGPPIAVASAAMDAAVAPPEQAAGADPAPDPAPPTAPASPDRARGVDPAPRAKPGAPQARAEKPGPTEEKTIGPGVVVIETGAETARLSGVKPFSESAGVDTRRFDGVAFLGRAQSLARRLYPDAVLTHFEVDAVGPDGRANLRHGEATYRFRSPSRSRRPADVPRGVEVDIPCMIHVDVEGNRVSVRPVTDEKCTDKKRPRPRCSLGQVWNKARALGAPAGNWVANIDYLWDGWFFDIPGGKGDSDFTESIKDDC
jgi:serine/threonine-protein kinase